MISVVLSAPILGEDRPPVWRLDFAVEAPIPLPMLDGLLDAGAVADILAEKAQVSRAVIGRLLPLDMALILQAVFLPEPGRRRK